jgi:hypothetical protein
LIVGCGHEALPPDGTIDASVPDAAPAIDLATSDLTCAQITPCGDCDPGCMLFTLGPIYGKRFPLWRDQTPDPAESDFWILPADDGSLYGRVHCGPSPSVWAPNPSDWNRGTISKINISSGEEARYFTVGCTGGTAACDGTNGCCAADDEPSFQARANAMPAPPRQPVQLQSNGPSRTIFGDEDLWIANRAIGGQPSVTRISDDLSRCPDRNGDFRLQTSRDVDGDGIIETDCNGDGQPDDLASVAAMPCTNGMAQEFFGLDDECLIATTNIGAPNDDARALAPDWSSAHLWAGTADGRIRRVDWHTGQITEEQSLPAGCHPFGAVTDIDNFAWWVTLDDGVLCYSDAADGSRSGVARAPAFAVAGSGITVDEFGDKVWLGGQGSSDAFRYAPDRKGGFATIGNGHWTQVTDAGKTAGAGGGGLGVTALWNLDGSIALSCGNATIVRIAGPDLPPTTADAIFDGSAFPAVSLGGNVAAGISMARDGNVWALSPTASLAVRVPLDQKTMLVAPDLSSPPKNGRRSPAGDRFLLTGDQASTPGTDGYSNFGTWPVIVDCFTAPHYEYVVTGCGDHATHWSTITWDGDVPQNSFIYVSVGVGTTPSPDQTWTYTPDGLAPSPIDFSSLMLPNDQIGARLRLHISLESYNPATLKGLSVAYRCAP